MPINYKPLEQFCICPNHSYCHMYMRNVGAGIVLISLAVYLLLFHFCLFLDCACFWRNKDAYLFHS